MMSAVYHPGPLSRFKDPNTGFTREDLVFHCFDINVKVTTTLVQKCGVDDTVKITPLHRCSRIRKSDITFQIRQNSNLTL